MSHEVWAGPMDARGEVTRAARRRIAVLALALSAAPISEGRAQDRGVTALLPEQLTTVRRADAILERGDVRTSYDLLAAHLSLQPGDFAARWRAARAAVFLGLMASDHDTETAWYRIGVAQADIALAAHADDRDVLRWAVAAKGRLALRAGARESVRLAEDVWHLDHHLLALFPDDALAHDILGTLNYEVLKLSSLKRMLGRVFMGADLLAAANWRDALEEQQEAVALDSASILFRLDLANTLAELGRVDEATAQLEAAASLPQRLPVDGVFKARVARRLAELRSRTARRPGRLRGVRRGAPRASAPRVAAASVSLKLVSAP